MAPKNNISLKRWFALMLLLSVIHFTFQNDALSASGTNDLPFGEDNVTVNGITVDITNDTTNSTDGHCSLREAVSAAENNATSGTASGECVSGSASVSDIINIPSGTYCLGSLLSINDSSVSLLGASGGGTLLDGGNTSASSATCASSPSGQGMIRISNSSGVEKSVTLAYLTIQGGSASSMGGGI